MRQQEQMQKEQEMINEWRTGVIFAYETALLAAAKKDLRATELLEFVAKKIENFGRQGSLDISTKNDIYYHQVTGRPAQFKPR